MAFKCENVYCPYGPAWDAGEEKAPYGQIPRDERADSYSQCPEYRTTEYAPWGGLCLNCIADHERDLDMIEYD